MKNIFCLVLTGLTFMPILKDGMNNETLNKCQYTVYVLRTDVDDMDGFTDEIFWDEAEIHLDTVFVKGEFINNSIQRKFQHLKKIDWYPNDPEKDFIRGVAFVSNCGNVIDTVYSDRKLKYWKKDDQILIDRTDSFYKSFGKLLFDE